MNTSHNYKDSDPPLPKAGNETDVEAPFCDDDQAILSQSGTLPSAPGAHAITGPGLPPTEETADDRTADFSRGTLDIPAPVFAYSVEDPPIVDAIVSNVKWVVNFQNRRAQVGLVLIILAISGLAAGLGMNVSRGNSGDSSSFAADIETTGPTAPPTITSSTDSPTSDTTSPTPVQTPEPSASRKTATSSPPTSALKHPVLTTVPTDMVSSTPTAEETSGPTPSPTPAASPISPVHPTTPPSSPPSSTPIPTPLPTATAWRQVGSDIDGRSKDDNTGHSVSLSKNGTRLAIGARLHDRDGTVNRGMVQVFEEYRGDWIQMGDDILGDYEGDQFGSSVSISADGDRVAVGAWAHDGRGQVKVFEFVAGTTTDPSSGGMWGIIGKLVGGKADDRFGWSVSLSADGTTVAVGVPNDDKGNGRTNSGCSDVFRLSSVSGNWTRLGEGIDGDGPDDRSGYAVSLSADGGMVAVGAYGNDGENGVNSGHVRMYANDEGGGWTQVGQEVDGEAGGDLSGYSVSLSAAGTVVAIGARLSDGIHGADSGHVRVYEHDQEIGQWSQRGGDIDGERAGALSGKSVSLSSDGSVVAVGTDRSAGNGWNGNVRVYKFHGNEWVQLGGDIESEFSMDSFGHSVSLSGNGSRIAIGAPWNDANGWSNSGHVRVYDWPQI